MKRDSNLLTTFGLMPMFSDYAAAEGLSFIDGTAMADFFEHLKRDLQGHMANPARLFGLRTEAMFAYVVAALSGCHLISQEDSGIIFSQAPGVRRPDFRLVTTDDQFLVEVKNFHQADPREPFTITPEYAASLRKYAAIMGCRLKLAVYWSKWKIWTMVDFAHLPADGRLEMGEAIRKNQMDVIGDCMVSTVPPLSLRFRADPTKPRTLGKDGLLNFTIGAVDLYANGQFIDDPLEKKLAWFFMLYGQWTEIEHPAEIVDGKLEYFEMTLNPREPPNEQPFSTLGFLSQMISRQYIDLTSECGHVKLLTPHRDPNRLGILIPKDFNGKALKLWCFQVLPNMDDVQEPATNSQQGAWTPTNKPAAAGAN